MLPLPWWFRSVWKWSTYSLSARRKERSPNRITFDRHSSLTDTLSLISFQGRRPSYRAGPIRFRPLATAAITANARIDE